MVAATFPNLSFENPPGTGPTVVSGSAGTYAFTDGDLLNFTFAGISEAVVFLETDFANIAAATADEVAALLELRVEDLGAANDGGFVRLTSQLTGEDVTIEVTGGLANAALNFPLAVITGETYAGGAPNGWAITTDTDTVYRWTEFADENSRPEEVFADTTPATQTVLFDLGAAGAALDGLYRNTINGADFDYAAVAVTRATVISNLIIAINGGGEPVTAAPGPTAESLLVTANTAGVPFTFSSLAPVGEEWQVTDLTAWLVAPATSTVLDDALFDLLTIPAPFETFSGWSATGYLTAVSLEAAAFDPFIDPLENYENGWGLPVYFAFLPVHLEQAPFNPEDYETGWGNPFPAPTFDAADFAGATKTADDFEDAIDATDVVQIVTAATGEWRVRLDNEIYTYTALGGDTSSDIGSALSTAIDTGSVRFASSSFGAIVSIWPADPDDSEFLVQATPAASGVVATFAAIEYPLFVEEWVGTDKNPDFD